MPVPPARLRTANDAPVRRGGAHVLYWMIAQRRTRRNFGLERAAEWARRLDRPLLVLEALRCGHRWATARTHAFVMDGMRDNAARCAAAGVAYYPYVEPEPGAGRGLLAALARDACVVVTDEYPCFFLPRMVAAAAARLPVRLEAVDGNGLLPLAATERDHPTAYAFRRHLQKTLPDALLERPEEDPLAGLEGGDLPAAAVRRWRPGIPADLAGIAVDARVAPVALAGGAVAGLRRWRSFLARGLARYDDDRNRPELEGSSGLSPFLHFGHLSVHDVFSDLAAHEGWTPDCLADRASGSRAGWWGMSEPAEAFLDELVTWRELGFNMAATRSDHRDYESLPEWAQETLAHHERDPREHVYGLERFDAAETHDEVWNAAQRQLRREGVVHNYLRMLWGKKILEWTESPREAARFMIHLNNRYALDGRDPNSYSGIFWCLGRYDRPWGPERPVYGKIRYMSSANTVRKLRMADYLARFAG